MVTAATAGALALAAPPASAHLIAADHGTVNVVGAAVFTVLSVPVSTLHDADDDHDGVLDVHELDRHEEALRAEIDRRLVVLDGAVPAKTVRVDLILSPEHGSAGDRAGHLVALKHATLDAAPSDLRVRCDLFGASAADREITFTATRHPASGVETSTAVLRPGAEEHAFFPPAAAPPARGAGPLSGGLLSLGALAVVMVLVNRRAPRLPRPAPGG